MRLSVLIPASVRRLLLSLLLSGFVAHAALAQPLVLPPPDTRVSVLTVLPGDAVYSIFGHTALRVYSPDGMLDEIYNYGTFDFGDPFFVPRFIYGQMDYYLSVYRFEPALTHYRDVEGRPILEQELNLRPEEVGEIYQFLQVNALPENRVYRYDFFFDNCSTRPRDVFEHVLGQRVQYGEDADHDVTFRDLLDPHLRHRPFLRAGIDVLLGSPADRPATPREQMYLPERLFIVLEEATILRDTGAEPLVVRTDTIAWVDGYRTERSAPPWALMLTLVLLTGGLYHSYRERTSSGPASTLPDALLFGFAGLLGILILFMWFISLHTVTGPNWNLGWALPTHLAAAYFLRRGEPSPFLRGYMGFTGVVSAVYAVFWFVVPQSLPVAFLALVVLLAIRAMLISLRSHPEGMPISASAEAAGGPS